ncbi:MAG: TIGR00725 family protein [Bacteroidota bacterium]
MKPQIAVIGDSEVKKDTLKYSLAKDLGEALVDHGYRIVSGGMGGVMEAVFEGARNSDHTTGSDTIAILPSFDPEAGNTLADIVIPTGLDLYRNGIVANSDAVIAIGGGSGTLSEMAHAWALNRLVIAYDNVEGWSRKLAGTKIDERTRYPGIEDMVFPVQSSDHVLKILNLKISYYNKRHKEIYR